MMLPPPEMPPTPDTKLHNVATVRIMRKELYERIWEESVAHVGPKLGLWPRRLSMLCEKNKIPMPNRAYWYRATADRKPMRTPLPDADQDWEITFVPSQPGPPKPLADETAAPRIVVPERLGRSYRLVQETREASKNASTDRGILILPRGCLDIRVSPASVGRACRIMHTLIKECERRGWTVRAPAKGWHRTIISISDCEVGIHLLEGWRQEPRVLSESEKKWEEEREWPRKRPPYDLKPNGRFTLRIECCEAVLYDHWRDGKLRRLEDMLDDVMARLECAPEEKRQADAAKAAAEEKRCEEARLRREEEARQQERQRLRNAEQARVDRLLADAEAWEQSHTLRKYINARLAKARRGTKMTKRGISPDSEFGKWLAWARAQADRLDPLVESPPSILDTVPAPPVESKKSFWEIMNSLGQS